MAHDVLAVPISTVASEYTSSTGGRYLDVFRSSLSPNIVQSLIGAQDWLRNSLTPINIEEYLQDIEKIEAGNFIYSIFLFNHFLFMMFDNVKVLTFFFFSQIFHIYQHFLHCNQR